MSIVAMKRLRLIALRSQQEELLKALQRLGCVEVDEPKDAEDDPAWEALARPSGEALEQARQRQEQAKQALALLERSGAAKGGLLEPMPTVSGRDFFGGQADASARETVEAVSQAQRELAALAAQRGKLQTQRDALIPWLGLDVPLETVSTETVNVLFGAVPTSVDLEELEAGLGEAGQMCVLTPAGKDANFQYLFLLCHKSAMEPVQEALQSRGFSRTSFRGLTGTAAENDRRLARQIAENEARAAQVQAVITDRTAQAGELRLYLDRVGQDLRREEAKSRLVDTEETFYLSGWFPAGEEEKVTSLLARFPCAWETADPTPEEYPQVPVKLKNGRFSRSMNTITEMYSLPAYDGIDPNPLMFPFFVVFFGMMMADMAYGLIMIAASLVFLKKKRPKNPYFMEGVLWCGISTFIWGAMTGGFLGDFIPQLLKVINPASTFEMPALFTPLTDTIAILLGSLVLGAIQVFTGMTVSVVKKVKDGEFISALFDEITWWIILAGTGMAVLGVGAGKFVLIAGFLMLAMGGTREAKGFGKLTSLVGLVYNGVSGFFSDILSYLRLMALMLAGSVIAQVFNTLAAVVGSMVPGGIVFFLLISLLGNAINLALNLLGCYVHDLRLQCLEFFNRFYKEGGRPFQPLNIDTQYVDIIKEEI